MKRKGLLFLACLLGVAGCQTVGSPSETEVSKPLAPMAKPTLVVGDTWRGIDDKAQAISTRVIAVNGEQISLLRSDGCIQSMKAWEFGTSDVWKDCAIPDGFHETRSGGSLWPLEVGKEATYVGQGSYDEGQTDWSTLRKCEVESQVRIAVAAGEYDTYKVACRGPLVRRDLVLRPRDQGPGPLRALPPRPRHLHEVADDQGVGLSSAKGLPGLPGPPREQIRV